MAPAVANPVVIFDRIIIKFTNFIKIGQKVSKWLKNFPLFFMFFMTFDKPPPDAP